MPGTTVPGSAVVVRSVPVVLVLAVGVPPVAVAARLGAGDAGVVFGAAWMVALVPAVVGTVIVWWTLRPATGDGIACGRGDVGDGVAADGVQGLDSGPVGAGGVLPGEPGTRRDDTADIGAGPAEVDPGSVRSALERALTAVVPIVVVLLVGSPWILSAFGRRVVDTGVGSLVLLSLAAVPFTVVVVAARADALRGRTRAALGPPAAAVLIALAVGWVLMPAVGVLGAAFGWLLAWSVAALSRYRAVATPRGVHPVGGRA